MMPARPMPAGGNGAAFAAKHSKSPQSVPQVPGGMVQGESTMMPMSQQSSMPMPAGPGGPGMAARGGGFGARPMDQMAMQRQGAMGGGQMLSNMMRADAMQRRPMMPQQQPQPFQMDGA